MRNHLSITFPLSGGSGGIRFFVLLSCTLFKTPSFRGLHKTSNGYNVYDYKYIILFIPKYNNLFAFLYLFIYLTKYALK